MTDGVALGTFFKKVAAESSPAEAKETEKRHPVGWNVVRFFDVVEECKTGIPIKKVDRVSGDYPYYGANGIIDYVKEYIFDGEYVLIAQDGSIGAIHYVNGKFWGNNHLWAVKVKNNILAKFFFYFLKTVNWNEIVRGATRPKVTKKYLAALEILVPPLDVQRRIVARIEEITSRIEQAKKLREEALKNTEAIMQSALHKLFDRGMDNGWDLVELRELIKLKSGEFLPSREFKADGPFLVYGGNGVVGRYTEYLFENPMVVIGRVGAKCGCVCISAPKSWITDNALYVAEKFKKVLNEFLVFALQHLNLNQYANQAAQPVISGKRIYPLKIFLPSIEEQKHIVSYLSGLQKKVEVLKKRQEETKMGIKALTQAVLEKAFSGKL